MITIAAIADDVLGQLGQVIDDAELDRAQVIFWVKQWADRLLYLHVRKESAIGPERRESGAFTTTYLLDVDWDDVLSRSFFELPGSIMDLHRDGGIRYVSYYRTDVPPNCPPEIARVQFSWTTAERLPTLYGSTMQKPTPARPYIYRLHSHTGDTTDHNRVYLAGVAFDEHSEEQLEVGLLLTTTNFDDLDINEPIDFPEELVGPLIRYVLDMGKFTLLLPQERLKNDGRANDLGAPPPAAATGRGVSINDPTVMPE